MDGFLAALFCDSYSPRSESVGVMPVQSNGNAFAHSSACHSLELRIKLDLHSRVKRVGSSLYV